MVDDASQRLKLLPFRTFTCTDEYPFVTFFTLRMTFDILPIISRSFVSASKSTDTQSDNHQRMSGIFVAAPIVQACLKLSLINAQAWARVWAS